MVKKLEESFVESDRYSDTLHPRENRLLIGHEQAEYIFLSALHQKKMHHAWLISGLEGIGKATLSYRLARFLLHFGQNFSAEISTLELPENSPVISQITALSHPNLRILRRGVSDTNKIAASITVDSVRSMSSLFENTSADGNYRICIVDSADDLNIASANALLKLIEEPPQHSLFLLISHNPQSLLPTIRSRCRRLSLRPLSHEHVVKVLQSQSGFWRDLDHTTIMNAVHFGEGSVKRTLTLLDDDTVSLIQRIDHLLKKLPQYREQDILKLAETISKKNKDDSYVFLIDSLQRWIHNLIETAFITDGSKQGLSKFISIIDIIENTHREFQMNQVYNLDLRPVVLKLFRDLSRNLL